MFLHLQSEGLQRLLIERLVFEQQLRRILEHFLILFQDHAGMAKGVLDDCAHGLIDLARRIFAVSSCWRRHTRHYAEEGRRFVLV